MATLSRRHPCARTSFGRRPENAFRACVEEGLREYEEDRRASEREKAARARMRSLKEVYVFHLDLLNAALSASRTSWKGDDDIVSLVRAVRIRYVRATPLRERNPRMPEA